MTKYTMLSIGPLYDTMILADNTRALWAASAMFSFLMRDVILTLKAENSDAFVVPNMSDEFSDYLKDGQRVGLFHDRLILKGDKQVVICQAFEDAVEKLSEVVVEAFDSTQGKGKYPIVNDQKKAYDFVQLDYEEDKIKTFIKSYFHSYIVCVDIPKKKNPILYLSRYVDAVEYEPRLARYEEEEYLFYFFRIANLTLTKYFAFLEDMRDDNAKRCFKSLAEISSYELTKNWMEDLELKKEFKPYFCPTIQEADALLSLNRDIFEVLQEKFSQRLKPYHKYVAIVHGDGDAFGNYLVSMEDDIEKIQQFSDNIFKFASFAKTIIEQSGGEVLVAGGDDLVFFAPVVDGSDNIFTLINTIDKQFKDIFKDKTLSMSYGISITYHKYPLQEAMEISSTGLWERAKKAYWISMADDISTMTKEKQEKLPAKNAIYINIQKHSGQSHSLTLHKGTVLYDNFIRLLEEELNPLDSLHLPHALHHSLERVATLVNEMPVENIEYFFANMFNEDIHKVRHEKALKSIQDILSILKDDKSTVAHYELYHGKDGYSIKKPSEVIFSILSIIKMLRGDV